MNILKPLGNRGSSGSAFCSAVALLFVSSLTLAVNAQPEVMAWGNITGIRVEGQLMDFESSLRVVENGWNSFTATGKERQQPGYDREGKLQTVTTGIGNIKFTQVVEDCGEGCAKVTVKTRVEKDTILQGIYFCIDLPGSFYSNAGVMTISGRPLIELSKINPANNLKPVRVTTRGMTIASDMRKLEISFNSALPVHFRKEPGSTGAQIYIELSGRKLKKGEESISIFSMKAGGTIDTSPAEIILDLTDPGRRFDGLGGNFRLQNPRTDPLVIDYCLNNLRIAWGRVEMPWNLWHPEENTDPVEAAKSGKLNPRVDAAMNMARRLAAKGMPVIISDWSAPDWAILGDPRDAFRFRSRGIFGYRLDPEKTGKIYKSIGDYIEYMKQYYGVEAEMFSFNESDLGINVRHTGMEHADFIKGLGSHLASRGLSTKLLLGDNSDATTFEFILPALNDRETHKYIGAVSFHSWRGCTDETLKKWAGAAEQLNIPLLVGEGSTDAAAWNYPEIFSEQSFALYEINLYTRILSICQPLSILQWQLTADYSILTGEGIFGTSGPLVPTQRFWNLKQLASSPEKAFAIPVTCNNPAVNCAALGNIARNEYAVHIVNNGAGRSAVIKGIPPAISGFDIYVTDSRMGMKKTGEAGVSNGTVELTIAPAGFTTLLSKP